MRYNLLVQFNGGYIKKYSRNGFAEVYYRSRPQYFYESSISKFNSQNDFLMKKKNSKDLDAKSRQLFWESISTMIYESSCRFINTMLNS